ncbi:MAG: DNA replication/repair protein RecF [Leucobacter sp.]
MRVTEFSLSDFRNYRSAEVSFAPGFNLVIGRNGQGKTNLVEAIAYFASLDSHRVSGNGALIRAGCDTAVARMRVGVRDREVLLEAQLNRGRPNRAQVNRNAVKPRELARWFSAVVFAPEDLMIVRGDPSGRRAFLDEAVVARNPGFIAVLADYDRVVRQRTSLLKSARAGGRAALDSTLEVWNEQLIELGTRIMVERRELARALEGPVRQGYAALVGEDHEPKLSLGESVYGQRPQGDVSRETHGTEVSTGERHGADVSRETLAADFSAALTAVRRQEIERAVTLIGPHRDDLLLELNGLPVKGYASHGESWSFALGLRLALARLLREESPVGDPVLILDDVFAELDAGRRSRLMSAVEDFEQVIVTAAVEADVPDDVEWRRIRIHAGAVVTEAPS